MIRAHRLFTAALLISLLCHVLLLASAGSLWNRPIREIPFPIEANLVLPEATPPSLAAPEPPPPKRAAAAAVTREMPPNVVESPPTPAPTPTSEPTPASMPVSPEPPISEAPPQPVPAAVIPTPPAAAAAPPALRALPEHLELRYAVQAGEDGFKLGKALYTWQLRDSHYSLVSIAEASGLASLFISGRIVQTSLGRVGPEGLRPDQYWLSRNERKQDMARFDWTQHSLILASGGVELPDGSQDLLSFPFHLALTVDEAATEWSLWVSNGRKLRDYRFRNLGRERLAQDGKEIETLHLQGSRAGEGTLDVWLAPTRHWLPARIRTLDQKGRVLVLSLEEE